MPTQKLIGQIAIALIGFEVGLALAYLAMIAVWGKAVPLLDLNGLRSLPSWLQAVHLGVIGLLCMGLLRHRRPRSYPFSRLLPSALAALCLFGAVDEVIKLHLSLNQFDWKAIYLSSLLFILVLGFRDLVWVWCRHRAMALGVLAGLGIFLLGGFGAELAKDAIASVLTAHTSSRAVFLAEHARITLEELAELLGETIILYAIARFARQGLQLQPGGCDRR
jgi:hypothetical protein